MSFAETRSSREMSRMASGERYPSVSWTFFRRGRRPFRLSRILCWTASAIRTPISASSPSSASSRSPAGLRAPFLIDLPQGLDPVMGKEDTFADLVPAPGGVLSVAPAGRGAAQAAVQQGQGFEQLARPLLPLDALPEVHILAFRIPRLERGPQGEILCREPPVDLPQELGRGFRPAGHPAQGPG